MRFATALTALLNAPRGGRLLASAADAGTVTASPAYEKLSTKLQQITRLQRVSALAEWDSLVMMPQGDANHLERGLQLAALASVLHAQRTGTELQTMLDDVDEASLGQRELANLREAKRDFERLKRVPAALAEKKAALSSEAYGVWAKARTASDFAAFAPTLQKCFDTSREVAACQGDGCPYDLSLDEFERGMSGARIEELFTDVKEKLTPLIQKCINSPYQPSTAPLGGEGLTFDKGAQAALSADIVASLGLDAGGSRLDVSVHPFSTSFGPVDVRITTRFDESEWYQALAGSVHEAGHSMYEAGLRNTAMPVDQAVSMGVHESQSLFWERHIGLSRPFWTWAGPQVRSRLGVKAEDEELYEACNALQRPSLIRVEADELQYPLHVIIRFEIERAVLRGELPVDDIPTEWNKKYEANLGVTPPSDAKGALQDVHWSGLAIGYFPSYLLGAMMAAQLWHHCRIAIPDVDDKIANGEFSPILSWLREKVHDQGVMHPSIDALLENAVGEPLKPEYFVSYLEDKFGALYKL